MTADEIRTRIDQLRQAIDSGVLTIQHGDTRTTYRSQAEMERALQALRRDLAVAEQRDRRRRPGYVYQSGKGL